MSTMFSGPTITQQYAAGHPGTAVTASSAKRGGDGLPGSPAHGAHEGGGAREEPGLTPHVVVIQPRRETLPHRGAGGTRLLGQIQLTAPAHREIEVGLADVVGRAGLVGVGHQRGERQRGAAPTPACHEEARTEMGVEVHEPEAVGHTVQDPARPRRGPAQPCQLAIRAVQNVRRDEQQHAGGVDPGARVPEQVAGDEPDDEARERHGVGRDARGHQRARQTPADRAEEATVGPLLYDRPLTRVHAGPPPRAPS